MSRLFATTAAIAALVAPPAYAADGSESGFYLGANAGVSRADTRKNDFDQAVVDALDLVGLPFSGTSSLDDRDTTYEFTVGYRVDSWLAVEAMYLDLGEVKYQADGEITSGVPASAGVDLERAGLGLSALVIVPLDKVDLFARVGVFYADTDYTVSLSAEGESASESLSDSTEEFFWGLGGTYQFADRWSARLEYRTFDKVGDSNSSIEADVNTLTLGIVYNFSRQ